MTGATTDATAIEPGRLRRAVFLDVVRLGPGRRYLVSGGARSHVLELDTDDGRLCDCEDHLWRNLVCKHILACQLREGDVETIAALRAIVLRTATNC